MKPLVTIVMGSDSDMKVMQDAAKTFEEFNIEFEIDVVSAHRTPAKAPYSRRDNGFFGEVAESVSRNKAAKTSDPAQSS